MLAWAALPLGVGAQAPTHPAAVDTLLEAAGIPGVVAGIEGVLRQQIGRQAPGLSAADAARLDAALSLHFAPERLYAAVATRLAEHGDARVQAAAEHLASEPVAASRALAASYAPPLSFQEYATGLTDAPPSPARVQLALRLARAQGAASFYLTLSESLRGAAHTALRAVLPSLPRFQGVEPDVALQLLETQEQQTTVLFLHRYETIPDTLLAGWAAAYESDPGQWFVDALAAAVRDAILEAAEAAAGALRGGR